MLQLLLMPLPKIKLPHEPEVNHLIIDRFERRFFSYLNLNLAI